MLLSKIFLCAEARIYQIRHGKGSKMKKSLISAIAAGIISIAAMLTILGAATSAADEEMTSRRLMGIMYHQVLKDESRAGRYAVTPSELEEDFRYFSANGFTSLLPSEIVRLCENGEPFPDKSVVITFDDGHETVLSYVLPLLQKYNLKAVVNIVGEYTDTASNTPENEKNLSFAYLTWEEVKELSDSGYVEIGNHTYSMHFAKAGGMGCQRLTNESEEAYRRRLIKDVGELQSAVFRVTGKMPVSFAYPFGAITEGSSSYIAETGVKIFFSCCELPSFLSCGKTVINRYNREHLRSAEQIYAEYLEAL